MATITGTAGPDDLVGEITSDLIQGLGDGDVLTDSEGGNDTLEGGAGDDELYLDRTAASAQAVSTVRLDGGSGDDFFLVNAETTEVAVNATIIGGSGSDALLLFGYITATISLDAGGDYVSIAGTGNVSVDFGSDTDIDLLTFDVSGGDPGLVTISNFTAGTGGDALALGDLLLNVLVGWDESNPFAGGFLRVLQSGANTLVQYDVDGGGNGYQTLVTLAGVQASQLRGDNFRPYATSENGFAPDGSPVVGQAITGTAFADVITGSFGADTINGGGGKDVINAGAGNDSIAAGENNLGNTDPGGATINGGNQNDTIDGGSKNDVLNGEAGNDIVRGNGGNDVLLDSGGGVDSLDGGAGNDTLIGSRSSGDSGALVLAGGADDDTINFTGINNAGVTILGGTGADTIQLFSATGAFTMTLGTGKDFVWLQAAAGLNLGTRTITITDFQAGADGDTLGFGVLLNATLTNYNAGSNPFASGHARLLQVGADTRLQIDADGGANSFVDFAILQGVTSTQLVTANLGFDPAGPAINIITGTPGPDVLNGTAGADDIFGLGASDIIDGGAGSDSLRGGAGDDSYILEGQADIVYENAGEGNDTVFAGAGYYLWANIEALTLADVGGGTANDFFGVGNELDNVLTGNSGSNLLIGLAGNDTISGGGGVDALFGLEGNDVLNGDAGIDYLVGGTGNDTLNGGANPDALYGQEGDDSIVGGASFDTDIFVGGSGNDTLRADSGLGDFDLIDGAEGDDVYYVDTPDDLTFEAAGGGTDTVIANIVGAGFYLYAFTENLILEGNTPFGVGNELANSLTGNTQGNYLLGGLGNDTLNGKGGNDVLFGESGADTFVFERGTGGDVIGDFQAGTDKIDIRGLGFSSFAQVQANLSQVGGTSALNLGSGDFIVLNGVANAALTAGDFLLG